LSGLMLSGDWTILRKIAVWAAFPVRLALRPLFGRRKAIPEPVMSATVSDTDARETSAPDSWKQSVDDWEQALDGVRRGESVAVDDESTEVADESSTVEEDAVAEEDADDASSEESEATRRPLKINPPA